MSGLLPGPLTLFEARPVHLKRHTPLRSQFCFGKGVSMVAFESGYSPVAPCSRQTITRECTMHSHLCSLCRAAITVDEGRKCPNRDDHDDGLCEACALAQPGPDEFV